MFPTFQVTLSSCPLQVANTGNVRIWFCLTIRCLLNKSRVEAGFSWTRSSLDYLDETIANWESLELKVSKARTFRLVYDDDYEYEFKVPSTRTSKIIAFQTESECSVRETRTHPRTPMWKSLIRVKLPSQEEYKADVWCSSSSSGQITGYASFS